MHIYFIRRGITTYEYIVRKRAKKAEKKKRQNEIEKEKSEIGKENNSFNSSENRVKSAVTVADVGMKSNGMEELA